MDQRKQAGGEDDAAELPPISLERGTAQARRVLLAAPGGEPPDAAAPWKHSAKDRGATIASRGGELCIGADFGEGGQERESVSRTREEMLNAQLRG
jgi:hypothetical protein